jgi:hypothetical protein
MLSRCNNPNHKSFKHYGGRGIEVHLNWFSYENFLRDMGRRPSPKHSLDRINNEGDYEKENCRWATASEQNKNTRRTKFISLNGESRSIAEWCEVYGIAQHVAQQRLARGMLPEAAFTEPVGKYTQTKTPPKEKARSDLSIFCEPYPLS